MSKVVDPFDFLDKKQRKLIVKKLDEKQIRIKEEKKKSSLVTKRDELEAFDSKKFSSFIGSSKTFEGEKPDEELKNLPVMNKKYRILKKLGSGEFGSVVKVQDVATKKIYAAKVMLYEPGPSINKEALPEEQKMKLQRTRESADAETKSLNSMNHPNIVKMAEYFFLDCDPTDPKTKGKYMIEVLEFVKGSDMDKLLEFCSKNKMFLPHEITFKWFLWIVKTLDYLHNNKRIMHRDLKPDNFLVSFEDINNFESMNLVLSDFGSALAVASSNSKVSGIMGHLYYTCSEALDNSSYDCTVDVFAFGIILFQMLFSVSVEVLIDKVDEMMGILRTSDTVRKNFIKMFNKPDDFDIMNLSLIEALSFLHKSNIFYDKIIKSYTKDEPFLEELLSKMICERSKRLDSAALLKSDIVRTLDFVLSTQFSPSTLSNSLNTGTKSPQRTPSGSLHSPSSSFGSSSLRISPSTMNASEFCHVKCLIFILKSSNSLSLCKKVIEFLLILIKENKSKLDEFVSLNGISILAQKCLLFSNQNNDEILVDFFEALGQMLIKFPNYLSQVSQLLRDFYLIDDLINVFINEKINNDYLNLLVLVLISENKSISLMFFARMDDVFKKYLSRCESLKNDDSILYYAVQCLMKHVSHETLNLEILQTHFLFISNCDNKSLFGNEKTFPFFIGTSLAKIKGVSTTYIAKFDFKKQGEDELGLKKDDLILVLKKIDAEWWHGCLVNDPSKKGLFPSSYVSLYKKDISRTISDYLSFIYHLFDVLYSENLSITIKNRKVSMTFNSKINQKNTLKFKEEITLGQNNEITSSTSTNSKIAINDNVFVSPGESNKEYILTSDKLNDASKSVKNEESVIESYYEVNIIEANIKDSLTLGFDFGKKVGHIFYDNITGKVFQNTAVMESGYPALRICTGDVIGVGITKDFNFFITKNRRCVKPFVNVASIFEIHRKNSSDDEVFIPTVFLKVSDFVQLKANFSFGSFSNILVQNNQDANPNITNKLPDLIKKFDKKGSSSDNENIIPDLREELYQISISKDFEDQKVKKMSSILLNYLNTFLPKTANTTSSSLTNMTNYSSSIFTKENRAIFKNHCFESSDLTAFDIKKGWRKLSKKSSPKFSLE